MDSPDRRHGDRRQHAQPPPGGVERRRQPRRATDVQKMCCPFCGNLESTVYKSGRSPQEFSDGYPRRRRCATCQRAFPTIELVDLPRLAEWLEKEGKTLKDLGLEP